MHGFSERVMTPSRTEVCVPLVRPSSLTRVRAPQQGISIDSISPPAVYRTSNSWSALGCEGTVSIPSSWACAGAAAANREGHEEGQCEARAAKVFSMGQASFCGSASKVRKNPTSGAIRSRLIHRRRLCCGIPGRSGRAAFGRQTGYTTSASGIPQRHGAQEESSRKNPAGRNGLRGL